MSALLDTPTPASRRRPTIGPELGPSRPARRPQAAIRLEAAGRSARGRRHPRNEDALLLDLPLVAVADGVGGAPGGDIAARCALAALDRAARGAGAPSDRLLSAFTDAHRSVSQTGAERDLAGMATTATAALRDGGDLLIAHVGDSRAYRLRGGRFNRLTRDDRLVAEMESRGMITEKQAEAHPWRSVITRALGLGSTALPPSLRIETLEAGDIYLLCTDGLTDSLPAREIAAQLAENRSLVAAAGALVRAATANGATDDVTVALIRAREGAGAAVSRRSGGSRRRAPSPATGGRTAGRASRAGNGCRPR